MNIKIFFLKNMYSPHIFIIENSRTVLPKVWFAAHSEVGTKKGSE